MQPFLLLHCRLYILSASYCLIKYMYEIVGVVMLFVVIVVVVVAFESSPSENIRGLIGRTDRGVANAAVIDLFKYRYNRVGQKTNYITREILSISTFASTYNYIKRRKYFNI